MGERWGTDEDLLAALGDGLASAGPPAVGLDAGRVAWARRSPVDANILARLDFDSALAEPGQAAALRSGSAQSARTLSFLGRRYGLELAVEATGMVGQVIPPAQGTLTLNCWSGSTSKSAVDDLGCFELPLPDGLFRISFADTDGTRILATEWTQL